MTPSNEHCTDLIINLLKEINGLKQNNKYYYDTKENKHNIIEINNLDEFLYIFI